MESTLSLRSERLGSELFSFFSESSKSVGRVTFCSASKLGMLNCGTEMSPNGLILLIAPIAVWMAEFAALMSFWMFVRIELQVLVTKLFSYKDGQQEVRS